MHVSSGEASCKWEKESRLILFDSKGDASNAYSVYNEEHEFMAATVSYMQEEEHETGILRYEAQLSGGQPPFSIWWSTGSTNTTNTVAWIGMEVNFTVVDSAGCVAEVLVMKAGEYDAPKCASTLSECACLELRGRIACYKGQFLSLLLGGRDSEVLGKSRAMTCKTKEAMMLVYTLLELERRTASPLPPRHHHGSAFFALRMLAFWNVDFRIMRQVLQQEEKDVFNLYEAFYHGHLSYSELLFKSAAHMIGVKFQQIPPLDTLIVSLSGQGNEAVFAPQFVQGNHQVGILLLPNARFSSASVIHQFTWPLPEHFDIDLSALFLGEVANKLCKARHLFSGDAASELIILKLSAKQKALPLSIQSRGAPVRRIIYTYQTGDLDRLQRLLGTFGDNTTVHLRSVYGQACGAGVPVNNDTILHEVRKKTAGSLNLDESPSLFLEEPIKVRGVRDVVVFHFLAREGRVAAAHLSRRVGALEYVTIADEQIQGESMAHIKSSSYTGFGALWWLRMVGPGNSPRFVHSRAYIQRHSCIAAILQREEKLLDPCVYHALGRDAPFEMVPAGRRYSDHASNKSTWNIRSDDIKLTGVTLVSSDYDDLLMPSCWGKE